ncbi:Thymidylate synthase [Trichinella spiralis]|uniref:Thymidylate synthase n=1 Tax=Trichinella spiralis TaxID=6334 RepID=A0ABR3KDS9_TRISP
MKVSDWTVSRVRLLRFKQRHEDSDDDTSLSSIFFRKVVSAWNCVVIPSRKNPTCCALFHATGRLHQAENVSLYGNTGLFFAVLLSCRTTLSALHDRQSRRARILVASLTSHLKSTHTSNWSQS